MTRDARGNGLSGPRLRARNYEVSGFVFETGESFPELEETDSPAVSSFSLRQGAAPSNFTPYHSSRLQDGRSWPAFARSESGFLIYFEDACLFDVSHSGAATVAFAIPPAGAPAVRRLYLDQVVPLILNLRGSECLHAAAVLLNGSARLFIGPSGAGKSTLAAALAARGYPLLADDCAALEDSGGMIVVHAGNRGSKLWPDSAAALCGPSVLPGVAGHDAKKLLTAKERAPRSAPLGGIYLLASAPGAACPAIREATAAEAVPILLEAAFRLDLDDSAMLERQFRFLMRLAASVPLRRLSYERDFSLLPYVCDLLASDSGVR